MERRKYLAPAQCGRTASTPALGHRTRAQAFQAPLKRSAFLPGHLLILSGRRGNVQQRVLLAAVDGEW